MAGPTADEQLYIELINEARLDPMGNAARYITSYTALTSPDVDIQDALLYFGVNGSALQSALAALTAVGPVAWNEALGNSAAGHNAAMIAADKQSHQLPGEASLGNRANAAGYTGWSMLGENVYAYSYNTLYGHAGFMVDWGVGPNGMQSPAGHRTAIMNAAYREIGVDVTAETDIETDVGDQVVTQDFGARAGKYFVLGAAYTDNDANRFYSVGEGRGDLVVQSGASSVTSAASGGYSLGVGAGSISVTLSGGGLTSPLTVTTTIGTENIKLDVVGGNTLLSSGSIVVTNGSIGTIRALGVRGVSLTASAGNQTIEGSAGNDVLTGGAGNDTIIGGGGTDIAVYSGNRSNYLATAEAGGYRIVDQRIGGGDGSDLVTSVELFRFADVTLDAAHLLNGAGSTNPGGSPSLQNSIAKLYHDYGGRAANGSELTYWTNRIVAGTTLDDVRHAILADPMGATHANAVINQLYQDYGGRSADSAELTFWRGQIYGGSGFADVRNAILADPLGRNYGPTAIDRLYQDYGGRSATADEKSYWYNQLLDGASLNDVRHVILADPLGTNHTNTGIDQLYQDYGGRSADSAELTFWRGQIYGGSGFTDVRSAILADPLGQTHSTTTITDLYQEYFRRAPTSDEVQVWKGLIGSGVTFAALTDTLMSDPGSQGVVDRRVGTSAADRFDLGTSVGHVAIAGFDPIADKIDLHATSFAGGNPLASAKDVKALDGTNDVLIVLSAHDTILLHDIVLAQLGGANFG